MLLRTLKLLPIAAAVALSALAVTQTANADDARAKAAQLAGS